MLLQIRLCLTHQQILLQIQNLSQCHLELPYLLNLQSKHPRKKSQKLRKRLLFSWMMMTLCLLQSKTALVQINQKVNNQLVKQPLNRKQLIIYQNRLLCCLDKVLLLYLDHNLPIRQTHLEETFLDKFHRIKVHPCLLIT